MHIQAKAWRGGLGLALLLAACSSEPVTTTPRDASTTGPADTGLVCTGTTVLCDGACVDPATDSANCGTCGTACTGGKTCSAGLCCAAGELSCGGACVDPTTSSEHCGECANACSGGQVCNAGTCGDACTDPLVQCDSGCANTASDPNNCGSCDTKCLSSQTCQSSACRCPSGKTLCGSQCVTTKTDPAHCGSCSNSCRGGQACIDGACTDSLGCAPGTYDFDGDATNGCEVTCSATGCIGPAGPIDVDAPPPFSGGAKNANQGSLSAGANLNSPMTGSSHTGMGSVSGPSAGPAMSGTTHKSQGGFLGR